MRVVVAVTKKNADRLSAFATAALALPGVSALAADPGYRSDDHVVSYNRGDYRESGDRMTINTDQVTITFPIGEKFEGSLNAIKDVTSGASPVVNLLNADGSAEQVLQSGASIRDERKVYDVGLGYYDDDWYLGYSMGRSREDDYESDYLSLDYRENFNDKHTTLFLGISYSTDEVWNTFDPTSLLDEPTVVEERRKRELMVGVGQVLDRNTVVQFNLTFAHYFGSLSDPYKKVHVVEEAGINEFGNFDVARALNTLIDNGFISLLNDTGVSFLLNNAGPVTIPEIANELFGLVKDSRPRERDQWIALFRASHFIESNNSALHFDYRYINDEWGANSHTVDIKWNKDVGNEWIVAPSIRYYSQSSASFYDIYFESIPADGYLTSDYRLAAFGAISAKLEVVKLLYDSVSIRANFELYTRQHSFAFDGAGNGDGLDDFRAKLFSLTIDGSF